MFLSQLLIVPLFLLLINASEDGSENLSSLKSVQILFRHGTRTTASSYATSTENQLTESGKLEMLELGQFIRNRYAQFLDSDAGYNDRWHNFVSSAADRTLQSASLFAYGLFRNPSQYPQRNTWNRQNDHEPVPVRSIPKDLDRFLLFTEFCPRYNDQIFLLEVEKYYAEFSAEHPDIIQEYSKFNKDVLDPDADTFSQKVDPMVVYVEEISFNMTNNLGLSQTAKILAGYPEFLNLKTSFLTALLDEPEEKRLFSGALLEMILKVFEEPSPIKFTAISGHDRALMGQLRILDQVVTEMPPPAASIIYELHERNGGKNDLFIKIFYRNNYTQNMTELKVKNCKDPCSLEQFRNLLQNLIPINFRDECQILPE